MPAAPSKRRLLIVEDELIVSLDLSRVLSHPEVEIETVANGVMAVARARATQPDVVLLDVQLPGMDGFEVFRILRREPALQSLRVIFLTAHGHLGALGLAKDNGAYAWIRKPFKAPAVRDKVFEALALADFPPKA